LADRPAIAVLPFRNLSPDPEQEYFAEGITEDIITTLSNWRSFPVISQNSTFALKHTNFDDRKISERLGARYMVQGSVRRSGEKVRITAELTDARSSQSLWSQRYDRQLDDIFEVQDDVAFHIAAAVAPEICRTEYQSTLRKNPNDFSAWDIYLHAVWHRNQRTQVGITEAKRHLENLINDSADFPEPYSLLASILSDEIVTFATHDVDSTIKRIFQLANKAHTINPNDPAAYVSRAIAHFWKGELRNAVNDASLAVQANPSSPLANTWLGLALTHAGEPIQAEPYNRVALKLSPLDPDRVLFLTDLTLSLLGQRRLEEALKVCEDALSLAPNLGTLRGLHVVILGHLERQPAASQALRLYLKIRDIRDEDDYRRIFVRNSALTEFNLAGLRKAGWSG
jgi:TolB-like protein